MSAVETETSKVAALSAKLAGARSEIQAKDVELNELRNRVVNLEDVSVVDSLKAENAVLGADLRETAARLADVENRLAKALRDVAAAAPALALVDALNSVKG